MTDWSVDQARQTYCLEHWGEAYVDVNSQGHVLVRPYRDESQAEIDLKKLVDEIEAQEIALPVLVRFQDILKDRINRLRDVFGQAFKQYDYQSGYTAVYPIKVNQQFSVVNEIIQHGGDHVGLEAGSKPELMAVLSLAKVGRHTIICNGYKDLEYIRLALMAKRLGYNIIIVLEKVSELTIVQQQAAELKVVPSLGLRLKLASMGKGKWQNTGGEKAKFGLTAEQILQLVDDLNKTDNLHWIELLHFHMGSQIANLEDIKTGLAEAAQYFQQLQQLGVRINTLDIGGGIGVDYEGRGSRSEFSVNYSLQDYASAVVAQFSLTCRENNLSLPHIITEAGRAMAAHHAVLITEVINAEQHDELLLNEPVSHASLVQRAWSLFEEADNENAVMVFQQMSALFQQAQSSFLKNQITINDRAELEKIYLACCQKIKKFLSHDDQQQQQLLDEINEKLADKLVCNFSVFQSVPDIWGIGQIFPIVPLQRLDQYPDRRAIIQDLTCDSDGQIEQYVDQYGIETTLPVHKIETGEKYRLGIFMVGAYQEILGDMHNLFGDTNAVNVEFDNEGQLILSDIESGDSIRELLNYVHFETGHMMKTYKQTIAGAELNQHDASLYEAEFLAGLEGYSYLE